MPRLEYITHGLACLALLYLPGHSLLRMLAAKNKVTVAPAAFVINAFLMSCVTAYIGGVVHYFSPRAGEIFSFVAVASALWFLLCNQRREWHVLIAMVRDPVHGPPLKLMAAALLGYGTMLYAGVPDRSWADVPMLRFSHLLPSDTVIPGKFAELLYRGFHPATDKLWDGYWRWSDRPPLQACLDVLAMDWFVTIARGILPLCAQMAGMVGQLVWIPATWHLLSVMRAPRRAVRVFYGMSLPTTFFFTNSCFLWPKLLAGALAVHLVAEALTFDEHPDSRTPWRFTMFGCTAAMAMLAHAGVAFFFFGLGPLLILRRRSRWLRSKSMILAGSAALVLYLPWVAYQKFVDPPGDRLIRTHLAGSDDLDPPVWELIRTAYERLTPEQIIANRLASVAKITHFEHRFAAITNPGVAYAFRVNQFFALIPALEFSLLGLVVLPVSLYFYKRRQLQPAPEHLGLIAGACVIGITIWVLLMFKPGAAVNHQGSYAHNILLFLMGSIGIGLMPARLSYLVMALQWVFFAMLWIVNSPVQAQPVDPVMNVLGFVILLLAVGLVPRGRNRPEAR